MAVEKIPFSETDKRIFSLRWKGTFPQPQVECDITQLDILQIMSYLKEKNVRLYEKFEEFIQTIDEVRGEKTDFERKLPRRELKLPRGALAKRVRQRVS